MNTKTAIACLLLGLSGAAGAQEPPAQAGATEPAATTEGAPVATGHALARDAAGRPVAVTSNLPQPQPHDLRAEFDALDRNGDGSISGEEAAADKYLARAFATYDSDRNQRLSFEETRRWLDD